MDPGGRTRRPRRGQTWLERARGGAGPGSTCEARPPFPKEVYAGLAKSQAGTRGKRGRRHSQESCYAEASWSQAPAEGREGGWKLHQVRSRAISISGAHGSVICYEAKSGNLVGLQRSVPGLVLSDQGALVAPGIGVPHREPLPER